MISIPQTWRKYATAYRLLGNQCVKCDELYLPPRPLCKQCKGRSLKDITLNGKGKIVSFTLVHTRKDAITPSPYYLAIIQLEEGPCITAQIVDAETLEIGQSVEMVFRKLAEDGQKGAIRYGFKFKVVA